MASVEYLRPIVYKKFHLNSNYNLYHGHGLGFFRGRCRVFHHGSNRFVPNSISFPSVNLYGQGSSSALKISGRFGIWERGCLKNNGGFRRSKVSATGQDSDSGEKSEAKTSEGQGVNKKSTAPSNSGSSSASNRRKEKQGKGNWWWSKGGKFRWQPIVQAQEIGILLLQLGIVIFVMRLLRPGIPLPGSEPRTPTTFVSVPYSEFLGKINTNQVQKVEVDGVHIMFKLKSEAGGNPESEVGVGNGGGVATSKLQESESLLRSVAPTKRVVYTTTRPADIKAPYEKMLENEVEFGSPDKRSGGFLNSALIALFYVALLAGLLHRFPVSFSQHSPGQIRNRKSGGSGGAKASEQGETITFADVAGVDEAKEELEEIVHSGNGFYMLMFTGQEFLRNPDRYIRLGARPPRGVLLVGLPGTGKTLLAKAVAGEAEVPFISCSASEFVELYVGMGASRVRDLFARAKKEAPSIIFIDEIDAVAKSRDGKFRIVSNDEREQTLNQLLTEMDGFDSNSAVIVLGATNRSDVLDPALRRPGRFDRVVMVETPDRNGREAILKVHVSKKELPLADNVDLSDIASMTTGFTGADLANLVNEAALLAGRENKVVVEKIDFIQAVERSIAGIEKKTAKLQGSEKAVVARHEAGHAVVGTAVANLLHGQPRVEKLSILPRSGGALGFTYSPPTNEDRYLLFIDELHGRLVTLLGGRAAEEVVYSGRVSTGALDDIRRATDMAYKAVAEYGLNQTIGPVSIATLSGGGIDESGGASPWGRDQGHLVDLVQREVKALLQSALDVALCVVRANPTVLEGLGAHLEDKEKVEGEELQEWLKLVVAPTELAIFIKGKQESLLPLHTVSG
ncbi:ATP-dependent zinc metalloprotease FTSH 9, chloroplastic isoform X1 [Ziziphus jujuba]|uniref:ATP-dependent zinc metalloprotease FTSH 9, chloroplastic isoform X1 n=1 Tax=Ziziphus jujuba TaxID=326968 RepID=A0A6P3Z9E6_ZIZJJ|nr:ATP-dependent zinc metalloprotease FTSH 9, chloroplastic isoform X1 [Ziziphus jujuba]